MDVVAPVTVADCQQAVSLHASARDAYLATRSEGQDAAVEAALAVVQGSKLVAESGRTTDGFGVWLRYRNGLLGALPLAPAGFRGGAAAFGDPPLATTAAALGNSTFLGSRRALLLSPFATELGDEDENTGIAKLLSEVPCPHYDLIGPRRDSDASLKAFQDMSDFGLISIASHGDTYFDTLSIAAKDAYGWFHKGAQELIWTGESINCAGFDKEIGKSCTSDAGCGSGARCVVQSITDRQVKGVCVDYVQADLRRGRIVFGTERYGILPTFITFHAQTPYPGSVVHLGSCRSAWNGSMAAAFFAMGARAILGYSGYVTSTFAHARALEFFERLIKPDLTGKTLPSGQAYLEIPDPANPTSFFRLIGARNLDAGASELVNPSFEDGTIAGWQKAGDGRVISRLGAASPVEGKFMGIVSTGLGFTDQTGELSQSFCIPAGATKLTFWWRYYSEEFLEWCGANFQDTFQVTLATVDGTSAIQPVNVSVDDLCPVGSCANCKGLQPLDMATIGFDQTDLTLPPVNEQGNDHRTYRTPWVKSEVALPASFVGNVPVTLSLFSTDRGDSIFDSAILIDGIHVE